MTAVAPADDADAPADSLEVLLPSADADDAAASPADADGDADASALPPTSPVVDPPQRQRSRHMSVRCRLRGSRHDSRRSSGGASLAADTDRRTDGRTDGGQSAEREFGGWTLSSLEAAAEAAALGGDFTGGLTSRSSTPGGGRLTRAKSIGGLRGNRTKSMSKRGVATCQDELYDAQRCWVLSAEQELASARRTSDECATARRRTDGDACVLDDALTPASSTASRRCMHRTFIRTSMPSAARGPVLSHSVLIEICARRRTDGDVVLSPPSCTWTSTPPFRPKLRGAAPASAPSTPR